MHSHIIGSRFIQNKSNHSKCSLYTTVDQITCKLIVQIQLESVNLQKNHVQISYALCTICQSWFTYSRLHSSICISNLTLYVKELFTEDFTFSSSSNELRKDPEIWILNLLKLKFWYFKFNPYVYFGQSCKIPMLVSHM